MLEIARKVKCRITGEEGTSDIFVKIDGKYYKNQQVYNAWNKENAKRKEVIDVICYEFLDYETGQKFPTVLTKKLKELEFYGYEVVLETIRKCSSSIEYAVKTKNFKNEVGKISYIMAIVQNNINDVYKEHNRKEKLKEKQDKQTIHFEAENSVEIMNIGSKHKGKDISDFLEDEWI